MRILHADMVHNNDVYYLLMWHILHLHSGMHYAETNAMSDSGHYYGAVNDNLFFMFMTSGILCLHALIMESLNT